MVDMVEVRTAPACMAQLTVGWHSQSWRLSQFSTVKTSLLYYIFRIQCPWQWNWTQYRLGNCLACVNQATSGVTTMAKLRAKLNFVYKPTPHACFFFCTHLSFAQKLEQHGSFSLHRLKMVLFKPFYVTQKSQTFIALITYHKM